jgi:hypothetical protein
LKRAALWLAEILNTRLNFGEAASGDTKSER